MITSFTDEDVSDQTGKTVFITGANTGLGFHAAKVLAARGAKVILGCRSEHKADDAVTRIRAEHPSADVSFVQIDLSQQSSVREAAEKIAAEGDVDVLINNAGVMMCPREVTVDGFELQMATNHFGHFALTGLLLPTLMKKAGSRVVITSSQGHRGGRRPFDDLTYTRGYSPQQAYFNSKLANLWHMYELDRRLRAAGAPTIAVGNHPGGSATELDRHLPRWAGGLWSALKPLVNTAEMGAWPTLAAATAHGVQSGDYFGPKGFGELRGPAKTVDSNDLSKDTVAAKRLWDISVDLTGVDPGI